MDTILDLARQDWERGRVSRKFEQQMVERHVGRGDIVVTVSKRSYIVFYLHRGLPAFGFYHSKLNLFVVWSPRERGPGLITVFRPQPQWRYLDEQEGVIYVWEPT